LIDGVAIHGVSGGPVFFRTADGAHIIGTTQYMANRLTGESPPGLSVAQDVSHFHKIVTLIKNRDEAARKKKEEEQQAAATTPEVSASLLPVPPTPRNSK
jgi:hypothetical protein